MTKRIHLIVVGPKLVERVESPWLSDEDARTHLEELGDKLGGESKVKLPWLALHGKRIAAAYIEERVEIAASRGQTGSGDSIMNKQF